MGLRRAIGVVFSGLRLKCPRCAKGALFQGLFTMHVQCDHCLFKFEREQGYFVGAMYINYGATVIIAMPGYFILEYFSRITLIQQLILWGFFAILFPLLFFRYSRSLWLSLDYLFNPAEPPISSSGTR